MDTLLNQYIKNHQLSWAPTTLKSESARLNSLSTHIDGNPDTLWAALQSKSPYTRLTCWTRVTAYWEWLVSNGHVTGTNPYDQWRKQNARLFRNVYKKERVEITYEDAKRRIESIADDTIIKRALEILTSAQRYSESTQPQSEAFITGKGNKSRPNFRPQLPGPSYDKSYTTFYRALKKVGLKPHTLRKLALTRLVDRGATPYDLMEVAGWSSIQTAVSYIQPKTTDKLKKLLTDE